MFDGRNRRSCSKYQLLIKIHKMLTPSNSLGTLSKTMLQPHFVFSENLENRISDYLVGQFYAP